MKTTLAVIYHDPEGGLYDQMLSGLPVLAKIFPNMVMHASSSAYQKSLDAFEAAGGRIHQFPPHEVPPRSMIGKARRACIELALRCDSPSIFYIDCDAALHWAQTFPQELERCSQQIHEYDFTVFGRTQHALGTLPVHQRETEDIVNHAFTFATGLPWQLTVGARGLSRRAAQAILSGCPDEEFTTDVSWPLYLQKVGGFSLSYLEVDGMEYETIDKYPAEVESVGGKAAWITKLDQDPANWIFRMQLACKEMEAMKLFLSKG